MYRALPTMPALRVVSRVRARHYATLRAREQGLLSAQVSYNSSSDWSCASVALWVIRALIRIVQTISAKEKAHGLDRKVLL